MPDAGLRRLWRYARRHRPKVIAATTYTTLGKVMDVVPEVLIGAVIDVIVRGQGSFVATTFGVQDRWHQLVILAIANAFVWIFESLFGYLSARTWRNLSQSIEHDMRTELYDHVQQLEVAWFEDTTSGGLLSVLNDDINQLERFLDGGASSLIDLFWNIVLVGAVFAFSSLTLTLFAFLPIPVIVFGSIWYQRRLEPLYARVRESVAELSATLAANLGGITTIKAFTAEARESERLARVSNDYQEANREAIRFSSAFVPLIRMAILAGFSCTLVIGGWLTLEGQIEVGIYSVLVFMTQRLLWPMTRLGETLDQYQRAMASTKRIFGLLDVRPTMQPGVSALALPVRGDIKFEKVSFGYADGGDVLRGLNIRVPSGETHAIVGATGAGKSTVIRLLMRFHDPRSGRVLIDGQDLRAATQHSLRAAIGIVPQDTVLFNDTLYYNLAYARPEASREEIAAAARMAQLHDFIAALPAGYETVVGERGLKLSGGEKQRVAIARAILKRPRILIFDEATSALDSQSEQAILQALRAVAAEHTTLVIAHRLSTIVDADQILVLDHGRVREQGTHRELLQQDGLYAQMWALQQREQATQEEERLLGLA